NAEIVEAEDLLGVAIPPSFGSFLRDFGWISAGPWEIFGLGNDVPHWLALVSITISERTEAHRPLPHHLLPFVNDGGGNLYCLDTAQVTENEEAPVVF